MYTNLIIEEMEKNGRLVAGSSRNLWPLTAYVLTPDMVKLPTKFDHNRSKTLSPMR